MNSLQAVYHTLLERSAGFQQDFYIPQKWNCTGFADFSVSAERPGEIRVNPYDFFAWNIRRILEKGERARPENQNGSVTRHAIYGMMPRFFTAWPHGADGRTQPGTFLKCAALLPFIQQMGFDTVYLLPVFEYSQKCRKGGLGSVYAIRNIYRLDENLHDPLLNGAVDVKLEFRAFVEACHALGIRVMLDFVFRTVARDSELIYEHPDWFYWIHADREREFSPPALKGAAAGVKLDGQTLGLLYKEAEASGYFDFFTQSPEKLNPGKWEQIVTERKQGGNAFEKIAKELGVTTAPGFSDVVNDRQPPWTDVTYLRFYRDDGPEAEKFRPKDAPACILQDAASLNSFPGREKNRELWEYTVGVIPFYKREYGIDGARIDMAHALPTQLCDAIIRESRRENPNFILWSEELDAGKSSQALQSGFDFISGFTYLDCKAFRQPKFNRNLLQNTLMRSSLPLTAALETPDTPRAALNCAEPRYLKMLTVLNCFLPNTLPMVTNGQELAEIQPMNLGLDNDEQGRYVLPESDPAYAKLAFFDLSRLHWLQNDNGVCEALRAALALRKRFGGLVGSREQFVWESALPGEKDLTFLCYRNADDCVFCAANRGEKSISLTLSEILPDSCAPKAELLYRGGCLCSDVWETNRALTLEPGEAAVGRTAPRQPGMKTKTDW